MGHYRMWSLASRIAEAPVGRKAVFTQYEESRRESLQPRERCVPREHRMSVGG